MTGLPLLERYASHDGRDPLVIALVINMPDAALQTTERQFRELLGAAGAQHDVRLRLFSFPEVVREAAGRALVAERYEPIDRLWEGGFDGLIVTGAEPRTSTLRDESYWPSLTRLVDWADDTGVSTVWSCLAAHAAVLHLDGIERRGLPAKLSGVFACERIRAHPLVAGMPDSWRLPHSRHNTLDAAELATAGYEVLSASSEIGADTFILQRSGDAGSLFVFYQGHPEYDPGALYREYRRDVGRFLAGTTDRYPEMPRGYFDAETVCAFEAFRARAEHERHPGLLEQFPDGDARERAPHAWRDVAVRLYANWLGLLAARRSRPASLHARAAVPVPVR